MSSFNYIAEPFAQMWANVAQVVPSILVALAFVLIGTLVGWLVKVAVQKIFDAIKLDKLLGETGLSEVMDKAGYKLNSGLFIGELVRWFFIVVFLVIAFDVVGLNQVTEVLGTLVSSVIPQVVFAVLLLFGGSILADFIARVVEGSVKVSGYASSAMLASFTKTVIWIFTIIFVLEALGVASFYLQALFTGIIFMLALAGGLAFGLGGKEAAAHRLKDLKEVFKK
jgi:hypothetical protein